MNGWRMKGRKEKRRKNDNHPLHAAGRDGQRAYPEGHEMFRKRTFHGGGTVMKGREKNFQSADKRFPY